MVSEGIPYYFSRIILKHQVKVRLIFQGHISLLALLTVNVVTFTWGKCRDCVANISGMVAIFAI